MRLSKAGYYADLVVYPPIVLALTAVGLCSPHSQFLRARCFRACRGLRDGPLLNMPRIVLFCIQLRQRRKCMIRLGCFSFRSALASIWRTRSRVTENCLPTSSKV